MSTPNPSLQKKSAARLCAAQCLYRDRMGERLSPEAHVQALQAQLAHNRDEQRLLIGAPIEPDYKLLLAILSGVEEAGAQIDARLDSALSKEWKRERMSPLLVAILQCGIFELFFTKTARPKSSSTNIRA